MLSHKFVNYLKNERHYSSHTIKSYSDDVVQFFQLSDLKDHDLSLVTVNHIRSWIIVLKKKVFSAKTINRKISALKTFFSFCKREEYININPFLQIKTLKESKRLPSVISESALENLFSLDGIFTNDFKGIRDRLIIEVFYQCGIRLHELVNLKLSDYDAQKKQLTILGKRNKERIIPLINDLGDLLDTYIDLRADMVADQSISFLFISNSGQKTYPKMIYRSVNHYLSLVSSSQKKSPHILRHAFATHLLNRGADLNAIKDLLGHTTLLSTQVYTQVSSQKIKKVYKQAHPRG